jgi:Protein of unknown function (DUF2845)
MTASRASQVALSLAMALAAGPARADDSLRCDGGLVATGDTALDLLAKCGPPALREDRVVERAVVVGAFERRDAAVVERWTYNFGPERFIQVVTLEGGKVRHVQRGGYGYPPERLRPRPAAGPARCEPEVHVGDTTVDVLAKCGEPALRDRREEQRAVIVAATGDGQVERRVTVGVETWTYDLGPDRFLVIATLENGKVVSVERGGYGYAR